MVTEEEQIPNAAHDGGTINEEEYMHMSSHKYVNMSTQDQLVIESTDV